MSCKTVFSLSEEETYEFGLALASRLRGGEIVVLEGDLGVGKTILARGIAASLGALPEDVTSPTFTLVQEYGGGRLTMFHVDLYRIEDPEEVETLGVDELATEQSVVVVEWGERLPDFLKRDAVRVRMLEAGEGTRRIEIAEREPARDPNGDA